MQASSASKHALYRLAIVEKVDKAQRQVGLLRTDVTIAPHITGTCLEIEESQTFPVDNVDTVLRHLRAHDMQTGMQRVLQRFVDGS